MTTTAQTYKIRDVKKGSIDKNTYGEYQNYALALEGVGEPVKFTRATDKPAPEIGDILHGVLEEFEAGGRTYYKLQPQARPEPQPLTKDEVIKSEWAISKAVDIWIAQGCLANGYDNIQKEARHFYQMINEIPGEQ